MQQQALIQLPGVISGIAGNQCGTAIIAINAKAGVVHSVSITEGQLEHVSTLNVNPEGGWSRKSFPFVNKNGYIRTNSFECAFSPMGNLLLVTSPHAPLLILSIPDLRIVSSMGDVGQYRSPSWSLDSRHILVNCLLETTDPHQPLKMEARLLDRDSQNYSCLGQFLVGRTLILKHQMLAVTLNDLQGVTTVYLHNATPDFQTYNVQMFCYVRPDGIAADSTQTLVAIVELDYNHRISIIDLQTPCQKLFAIFSEETTRPDHAHNLSLAGFDTASAGVYAVGPAGSIYFINCITGQSQRFDDCHDETTGLITLPCNNCIISSGSSGTLKLWKIPTSHVMPHNAAVSIVRGLLSEYGICDNNHITNSLEFADDI